jgi:hypothetical protein
MPLIDPITMSSTLTKGATAQAQETPAKPSTYALHPVQTKQTPLSQTARHALPALLAGLFAVRFPALVANPVSTMATTLPITTALQIAYAVLSLPVAGGSSTRAARKTKPRAGESSKKRSSGEGVATSNAVVVRLTSALPHTTQFLPIH